MATSRNQASKTGPTRQVPGIALVHAASPSSRALRRYILAMGNLRRRPYHVPIVSIRANPNSSVGHLARLLLVPPKVLPPRTHIWGLAGARNSRYRHRGRFFLLAAVSLAERTLLPLTAPDLSVSAGDNRSPWTQRSSSLVQTFWSPTFVFAAAYPFSHQSLCLGTATPRRNRLELVETTAPVPSRATPPVFSLSETALPGRVAR